MSMRHIVIIDDDALVGLALKRVLERTLQNVDVLSATSGSCGLALIANHATTLCLVILEVHLPDVDGRLIGMYLRTRLPRVPVLPLIGSADAIADLRAIGCESPLLKPYPLR